MNRYPIFNLPSHFTTVAKVKNHGLLWSRKSRRHKKSFSALALKRGDCKPHTPSTFKGKKSSGWAKIFLILTVNLQLCERNYRFISVTNPYVFLIFLINVFKSRKIIPLIYKPKNRVCVPNYFLRETANAVGRISRPTCNNVIPLIFKPKKT